MSLPIDSVLLTDFYQLTMLQGYHAQRMNGTAVFEFFVRKFPGGAEPKRNFLVAAGLEQALDFLEGMRFRPEEIEWLRTTGRFAPDFLDALAELRFTGDVDAMAEGTVCFPGEPILRVTAPLPQAQLAETRLINLLHFQTLIASKAARMTLAAPRKLLIDFGLRRAHGAEAGLLAARAACLAGFAGTSDVLAGRLWGIPLYGTMAHSFVQAHDDELTAFEHFALAQPDNLVLLIDTYDTEAGAEKLIPLAERLAAKGIRIQGVRLDSGDLAEHARRVRNILDRGGLGHVSIFASGSLDEYLLARHTEEAVPIDGYGIGTRMDTSSDAPYLDCAYKLQEYAGIPRRKRSEGKATWPGRKQVYRYYDGEGKLQRDSLTLVDDAQPGEPLLRPVMRNGRRLAASPSLQTLRTRALEQLGRLPEALRRLAPAPAYPVEIAGRLKSLVQVMDGHN
ncbi:MULTISPECIES: nicotinate phosphoribosyltransferase [Methylococcus]|uniref:Nicotinate phosphoribosyltransferase n=1 Tax=Methylococcus capsulatus TaxID=414 RepID=A0ABZ2F646_METCP|nr:MULTISPECIES: nicotinate phosphoribosyltransferase [Methylococcus]MDF9392382.1 nicotinate phosphoribosyltransferase [Methylococcus capsulatus]